MIFTSQNVQRMFLFVIARWNAYYLLIQKSLSSKQLLKIPETDKHCGKYLRIGVLIENESSDNFKITQSSKVIAKRLFFLAYFFDLASDLSNYSSLFRGWKEIPKKIYLNARKNIEQQYYIDLDEIVWSFFVQMLAEDPFCISSRYANGFKNICLKDKK